MACLAGAAVVFTICSIVQVRGGSSMFSTSYPDQDNVVFDALINMTWWPGWIFTVGLVVAGLVGLFGTSRD